MSQTSACHVRVQLAMLSTDSRKQNLTTTKQSMLKQCQKIHSGYTPDTQLDSAGNYGQKGDVLSAAHLL
jgi:hypothetical protein